MEIKFGFQFSFLHQAMLLDLLWIYVNQLLFAYCNSYIISIDLFTFFPYNYLYGFYYLNPHF
jgi:hypothetical protein